MSSRPSKTIPKCADANCGICPWCIEGDRRLEAAFDAFERLSVVEDAVLDEVDFLPEPMGDWSKTCAEAELGSPPEEKSTRGPAAKP